MGTPSGACARRVLLCVVCRGSRCGARGCTFPHMKHDYYRGSKTLVKMINFLNLEAEEEWLKSCIKQVNSVHSKRNEVDWSSEARDTVEELIEKYWFLRGYSL